MIGANDTEVKEMEKIRSSEGFRPRGELQTSNFQHCRDAYALPKLGERSSGGLVLAERSVLAAGSVHAKAHKEEGSALGEEISLPEPDVPPDWAYPSTRRASLHLERLPH